MTIIIFIIGLDRITLLFVRKANGYGTDIINFYHQKKNSIDIIYLGSSHTYTAFNPYLIEDKTGLKGYILATQQQPIWITYYYFLEALKYQHPKYVVLDVHMLTYSSSDYAEEQSNRDAIDKMKLSKNKLKAIKTSVPKDERNAYYFNIIKYHTRYKELHKVDLKYTFLGYSIDNKGYIALDYNNQKFNEKDIEFTEEENEIYNKSEKYLEKIIELAKKNNIELILVKTPAIYKKEEYAKLNYINKYLNNKNIKYINFIDKEKLKIFDYEKDFYDTGHLTKAGSEKFTLEFIKYLEEVKYD